MNTDKKLALLANEFNATIDHATDVLEEYADTLTEKILVNAFNELSEEDQKLVLMGLLWETKPEVINELANFKKDIKLAENKPVFDFDFAVEHNLDYEKWEELKRMQRLESISPWAALQRMQRLESIRPSLRKK